MKIGIGQLNPRIGDFSGNTRKILEMIERARSQGHQLIAFPELALSGYPPRDLLDYPSFVDANLSALQKIAKETQEITVICGFIDRNTTKSGRPYFNSAAILQNGKTVASYHKQLLPYYDVFDESRYFEPGNKPCILKIDSFTFAVTICEDLWNQPPFVDRLYDKNPLEALRKEKLDFVINISASPFSLGKPSRRIELFQQAARELGAPVLFCNQVGGNDELLFDGCSFAVTPSGKLVARGPAFEQALLRVDTSGFRSPEPAANHWPTSDGETLFNALQMGLRDYVCKCGAKTVCLGLSGGIDSSVVAAIAAKALGPQNVTGISLPTRYTSQPSIEDARTLSEKLGIFFHLLPIEDHREFYETKWRGWFGKEPGEITRENLQPRIRMTLLMAYANEGDHLLLNTSNKSEIATGFATLYGDSAGAISVLGDVTKGQVYEIAKCINREMEVIPNHALTRAPTAELKPGQIDQDVLPCYEIVDRLVSQSIEHLVNIEELAGRGFSKEDIEKFKLLHTRSEYKRHQLPPVLRVSERAFGMGRRIPIAAKYPWQKR